MNDKNQITNKLSKETSDILLNNRIPDCPVLGYSFDEEIKVENNKVIIGKCNNQELFIDSDNYEAVYLSTPSRDILLNSSLASFIKYIDLFNTFVKELNKDKKNKMEYIKEWEDAMIKTDEKAFYDKDYYWGAYSEDYQNGMLS